MEEEDGGWFSIGFVNFERKKEEERGREIAQKITSVIIAEFRRDLFARRRRIR